MAKRDAEGKTKTRAITRRFDLGDPGATIRFEYPLGTRAEILWSFITPLLFIVGGGVSLMFLAGGLGIWISFGAVGLGGMMLLSALRKESGVLFLDGERLQLGPPRRTRHIPLLDILGTSRGIPSLDPVGLEHLVVRFGLAADKRKVDLAAALVPRAIADEIEKRIALRIRAAATGDPRALEAVEARHLAGSGVIGVHLSRGVWRPFSDTAELASVTGAHPFRSAADRVTICVSPAVWEAIATVPDLAARVDAIVVAD